MKKIFNGFYNKKLTTESDDRCFGPSGGTESAQKKAEVKEIRRVKIEFTADERVAKK